MHKEKTDLNHISDLIIDIENTLVEITSTENKLKDILLKLCDLWDKNNNK
jgi:hypothetical protein